MFCKSGILIFIFAEINYNIYAHTMLIKTPLLHQSLGPCVFLSFSLYFWLISWNAKASYITQEILAFFLLSLSRHGLWTTRFWSIKGPQHPAIWVDSLPAEPQGKPKNTGVRTYPFPSGSSWPRNWTRVSCIADRFFTNWAMREAHTSHKCQIR